MLHLPPNSMQGIPSVLATCQHIRELVWSPYSLFTHKTTIRWTPASRVRGVHGFCSLIGPRILIYGCSFNCDWPFCFVSFLWYIFSQQVMLIFKPEFMHYWIIFPSCFFFFLIKSEFYNLLYYPECFQWSEQSYREIHPVIYSPFWQFNDNYL